MEAKKIVEEEVLRQAEFGMEPSYEDMILAGIRQGRREVVEWINLNRLWALMPNPREFVIYFEDWRAKLKEWGLPQS